MAIVKEGDLFENTHRYDILVQQCNCVTTQAHGLSEDIARNFGAYADPYAARRNVPNRANCACEEDRAVPGTVCVRTDPQVNPRGPTVACIFGQWSPGALTSKWPATYPLAPGETRVETAALRERWFFAGLSQLAEYVRETTREPVTIAFPYHIGCGLAGGNWEKYAAMIAGFADEMQRCGHSTVIYKKRV